MTANLKQRIKAAIHNAIERRRGSFTGSEIALDVIARNPELWEEAREVLATEKLIGIATGTMRVPKDIRAGKRWVDLRDAPGISVNQVLEIREARAELRAVRKV